MKTRLAGVLLAGLLSTGCVTVEISDDRKPTPPAAVKAALADIADDVSEPSLRGYIEKMVSFGTRHTLSDTTSPTRGIGAARRWVETEFRGMSAACGGCFDVVLPSDTVTAQRVPNPTLVVDVVAIQRGTTTRTGSSLSRATSTAASPTP